MSKDTVIHWFRQDLRLADNPALSAAAKEGDVIPVYILDDENAAEYKMGAASRWWLHQSLTRLNESLQGKLIIRKGKAELLLSKLIKQYSVKAVYWNRCYEPWRIKRDTKIKDLFKEQGVDTKSFNGSLLWEPWEVLKADGDPYKVFTPFYRKGCLNADTPRKPLTKPKSLSLPDIDSETEIDDLNLLPKIPWHEQLEPHWQFGEQAAKKRLNKFIKNGLTGYKKGRDFPAKEHVSRLSPYLHWGELSPNQVWHAALEHEAGPDREHFHSELAWREFSYSLLYHFPDLPKNNLQAKFDNFPWLDNESLLQAWQQGKTGYPIVDAGMRELWQTGYMHNRVRMIVGSFLVKNLLLHWHYGEAWFWDCLIDADLANNSASWQWIAGCGADAAPYFRVFNPVTQGKKFDSEGDYTRKYVPELAKLPDKYLYEPWQAPQDVLDAGRCKTWHDLSRTYRWAG